MANRKIIRHTIKIVSVLHDNQKDRIQAKFKQIEMGYWLNSATLVIEVSSEQKCKLNHFSLEFLLQNFF